MNGRYRAGMPADIDLPALHAAHPEAYPFLLESVAHNARIGRFDILFARPGAAIVSRAGAGESGRAGSDGRFLAALDAAVNAESDGSGIAELPFSGGWFLYLGYELAAEIEPVLALPADPLLPVAAAIRCRAALVRDRETGAIVLVSEEPDIDELAANVATHASGTGAASRRIACDELAFVEDDPARFIDGVRRARRYIAAGDIYQANLSREWRATGRCDPAAIYAALRRSNPAPFAASLRMGTVAILSSSPERLLEIRGDRVQTRPIAGTRPRSTDVHTDDSLSAELFAHPKERAEHVMLVDLERNDLGRLCEAGTVEVDEYMALESYAHVHHIVSNVRGIRRADVTPGDAIAAVFPGGTITGCPKIRCMQIIAELERAPRGAYTGSVGYLNRDGSMDLNILIRTLVQTPGAISFRAGAGIVADSDPDAEVEETRAKAKGLLAALATVAG